MALPTGMDVVDRTIYRSFTAFIGLNLVVTLVNLVRKVPVYHPAVAIGAAAALIAGFVVALRECAWSRRSWWGLRFLACLGLLIVLGHVWWAAVGGAPALRHVGYPPLLHVTGATVTAATAACSTRLGLAMIVTYVVAWLRVRLLVMPPGLAVTEATLLLVSQLTGAALVALMYRAVAEVREVGEATVAATEQTAAERARVRERARWDGLVHDRVLAALRLGAQSDDRWGEPVRESAREALDALHRDADAAPVAIEVLLARHALAAGLTPRITVGEDAPDPAVRDALVGAATEAITNVARHACVDSVEVDGEVSTARAVLRITDHGVGMPLQIAPDRAGVARSVVGRMRAFGGEALVWSRPGAGTVVTLRWAADAEPAAALRWSVRTFIPMIALGTASTLVNVGIGWRRPDDLVSPTLGVVVLVAIVITGIASVTVPRTRPWVTAVAAACVALPMVGLLNVRGYGPPDWRYWIISALTPAVAALAFRTRPRVGLVTAGGMLLAVVAADLAHGQVSWIPVLGPFPVLFGLAAAAGMSRLGLNRGSDVIAAASAQAARARAQRAAAVERDRELARRMGQLREGAVPILERLRDAPAPLPGDAAACRWMEARVRDQLVAGPLIGPELVDAVDAARRRGVAVTLSVSGDTETGGVAALREAAAAVLPLVSAGFRVRVSWDPFDPGRWGTVSLVGPVDAGLVAAVEAELAAAGLAGMARVDADDDAVLVELAADELSAAGRGTANCPSPGRDPLR